MNSVMQGFNFEKLSGKREKEREERERERGERKRERGPAGRRSFSRFSGLVTVHAPASQIAHLISGKTSKFHGERPPDAPGSDVRSLAAIFPLHRRPPRIGTVPATFRPHAPDSLDPLLKSGLPTKNHGHRTTDAPGSERFPARGRKSSNGDFSAVRPPFCSPSVPLDCSPHDLQICKISQQTATVGNYCSGDGCR